MKQLQFVEFSFGKMRLSENTSERPACDLTVVRDYGSDKAILDGFGEFHMASRLSRLVESGFEKFAPEFTVRDRLHAAISSSK
jgi:hypothetical protein